MTRRRMFHFNLGWLLFGAALAAVLIPLGFRLHWAIGAIPVLFLVCGIATVAVVRVTNRQFGFSLCTMFVVVTVLGVLCGLLGLELTRVKQQLEVVTWVKETGGRVGYDYNDSGLGSDNLKWSRRLRQFHELTGVNCDAPVDMVVFFPNAAVTDLSRLGMLMKRKMLGLNLPAKSVADLSRLSSFKRLEKLYLSGTSVTDVSPLTNLTGLRTLHLSDTSVRDLSPLTRLTSLKVLFLSRTPGTAGEVAKLQKALPNCTIIR